MFLTVRTRLLAAAGALVLGALVLVAAAGAAVLHAGDGAERSTLKMKLDRDGEADRIEIVDLDELEVGDSRDYTTDSGKSVTVTRDEEGFALVLDDGKTIRVGDPGALHGEGHLPMKLRRIEIDGDGEPQQIVISGEPREQRLFVRHRGQGGHGEQSFAFSTDGREPHLLVAGHGLLERIERSEKFQALDDATRELVRELVREAAQPLTWVDEEGEPGERVEVWIERAAPDDEQ
jgi:hypothetical protein